MENRAFLFLDYNGTFDDISNHKGAVFIGSLRKFIDHFNGNIEIAIITSAPITEQYSIKPDVLYTLSYFPNSIKEKFRFLIEENCKYYSFIDTKNNQLYFSQSQRLSLFNGTKKDGVECILKIADPNKEVTTCVFAGDSEYTDINMLDADIGKRNKMFILANRRILKTEHPVYHLSMKQNSQDNVGKEIYEFLPCTSKTIKPFIIKTSTNSFGVGKALNAATSFLCEKEKEY